ncbi:MAG: hypothetical protein LBV69_11675 [Bacteroidales bacterium]|nr:hypothetical protein [Bacteroidales bacterium]
MKRSVLQKWINRNKRKMPITLLYMEEMPTDKVSPSIDKGKLKGIKFIGNGFYKQISGFER